MGCKNLQRLTLCKNHMDVLNFWYFVIWSSLFDRVYFCIFKCLIVIYCLCRASASEVSDWKKLEVKLEARGTSHNSRLQLTTNTKGVTWFDQVSVMPLDTYKVYYFLLIHLSMSECWVIDIWMLVMLLWISHE